MLGASHTPPKPNNVINILNNSNAAPPVMHQQPAQNLGDEQSISGRFAWTFIAKEHIPYIIRSEEYYCSVRMIETKVLNNYLRFLHPDICNWSCIHSYYITEAECSLLNEINIKHCDYLFGRDLFTRRDLIVRLTDVKEFYFFLHFCFTKLLSSSNSTVYRCGFICINKRSVIPYIKYNNQKYVPLFYFEGATDYLKSKACKLRDWDLAYLKFCCKIQGIGTELYKDESWSIVPVCSIKRYFPIGALFENCWPSRVRNPKLLINGGTLPQAGRWTSPPGYCKMHPSPRISTTQRLQNAMSFNSFMVGETIVTRCPTRTDLRPLITGKRIYPSTAPELPPPPPIKIYLSEEMRNEAPQNHVKLSALNNIRPKCTVPSNYLMVGETSITPCPRIGAGPMTIGTGLTTTGPTAYTEVKFKVPSGPKRYSFYIGKVLGRIYASGSSCLKFLWIFNNF